ncbi:unnamed protein product [Miscanthus lutarioriparius]|uniref:Uncharacterized protein n=1 Tax=Miscanthus lutarioriparius TaxID=422564 RepID=A0A811SPJ5_9POAL|nr:unnamed protein product [Miscanthus lutarioriparius]
MGPRKRPQHPSDDAARAWTHKPIGVRDTCVNIGKRMLVSNFTAILVKMSDPLAAVLAAEIHTSTYCCRTNIDEKSVDLQKQEIHSFAKMFAALQALLLFMWYFHGRTLDVIAMSCDKDTTRGFGPLVPGHLKVDFQAINGLKKPLKLETNHFLAIMVISIAMDLTLKNSPMKLFKEEQELALRSVLMMLLSPSQFIFSEASSKFLEAVLPLVNEYDAIVKPVKTLVKYCHLRSLHMMLQKEQPRWYSCPIYDLTTALEPVRHSFT